MKIITIIKNCIVSLLKTPIIKLIIKKNFIIFKGLVKLLVGYIIYKFLKFVFEIVHIALIVLFVVFGY